MQIMAASQVHGTPLYMMSVSLLKQSGLLYAQQLLGRNWVHRCHGNFSCMSSDRLEPCRQQGSAKPA
jgi:hypothetical protein